MAEQRWQPPADQQDRSRHPSGRETPEPRNFERDLRGPDVNGDRRPRPLEYEEINMHGSER